MVKSGKVGKKKWRVGLLLFAETLLGNFILGGSGPLLAGTINEELVMIT